MHSLPSRPIIGETIASFSRTTSSNFSSHFLEKGLNCVNQLSELFHPKETGGMMQHFDQHPGVLGGLKDTSLPRLSPKDQLVSRTEQILINRPFQVVTIAMENRPLNEVMRPRATCLKS
jgi:hypothetical protein